MAVRVAVAVGSGVGVAVGVAVAVGSGVGVAVGVAVGFGVCVGVGVAVGSGVDVAVGIGVETASGPGILQPKFRAAANRTMNMTRATCLQVRMKAPLRRGCRPRHEYLHPA